MTPILRRLLLPCAFVALMAPLGAAAADLVPKDVQPLRVEPDAIKTLRALSDAFVAVNEAVQPAVVSVRSESVVKAAATIEDIPEEMLRRFFAPGPDGLRPSEEDIRAEMERRLREEFRTRQQGSGFIINGEKGYILTNHHVVADAREISVTLEDRRRLDATVIGSDADSDIALIRIDATDLPQVALGDDTDLKVGEWVVAVGSPFGLTQSVTAGIISAKGRGAVGILEYEDFIQTDAAINPGNSGGPLINLNGEVVGMNTAIASRGGSYDGVGFAIPISMVRAIAQQLLDHGKVTRAYLGVIIQDVNPDMVDSLGLKEAHGALVSRVYGDSPADKAGITVGDVIVSLEGRPIRDVSQVRNTISLMGVGRTVALGIVREGRPRDVTVTTDALPADASRRGRGARDREQTPPEPPPARSYDTMGLSVQDLTPALATEFNLGDAKGVLISGVTDGSPADRIGLQPGQLIMRVGTTPVASVEEFEAAIGKLTGSTALLLLRQGDQQLFVSVPLE